MNTVINMAMKDMKLLLRDKMGAFFIFGFPVMMGIFFGMMYPGASSSGTKSKMRVVVVDQDKSEMSQKFIQGLSDNENLAIDHVDAKLIDQRAERDGLTAAEAEEQLARDSVRLSRRVGMMLIPPGFGEKAGVFWGDPPEIQLGMDPSRGAEAAMMEGFVMESMGQLFATRFQEPNSFLPDIEQAKEDIQANTEMDMTQKLLMSGFLGTVETMINSADQVQQSESGDGMSLGGGNGMQFADVQRVDVLKKVDPDSTAGQVKKLRSKWDISFPQAILWGVMGCVAGFAISIARERTEGTMVRLQVAPLSKFEILLGKAVACFLAVLMVSALMVLLGYVLGLRPVSYAKLLMACVCMAFCFVGIMMSMSVLGKTEQSVSGSGWAVNMVMAMLGGCMIPVMFMPEFLQNISFISPIRWAIQAIEGAVWRDFSWMQMLLPCTVLVMVGVIGLVIGTTILNRRTD